ncbi:hypothetical protein GCM10023187_32020 [Nibrella viscosa]|uniref:Uncharacterized protein n=1 Tax=Nibrella viscosa TaxID=1084524 RepID=A0ABP8KLQ4_9BACT
MKTTLYVLLMLALPFTGAAQSPANYVRSQTFVYEGTRDTPLTTNFVVEKDEYVYIEVSGDVYLGPFTQSADATGKVAMAAILYNKYSAYNHGALVCQIGNWATPCQELFRFVDVTDNLAAKVTMHTLIDPKRMVRDRGINYIPGTYFLSPTAGPLVFDLNDTDPGNNKGSFRIQVYAIKKNVHYNRNFFNVCPATRPSDYWWIVDALVDSENDDWKREGTGAYYHRWSTFRGKGKFAGCQCAYFQDNSLDTSSPKAGSFDFAYALTQDIVEGNHLHVVLDMLPHELYKKHFPGEQYRRLPDANILRSPGDQPGPGQR